MSRYWPRFDGSGVRIGGIKFWGIEGVSWNYGWNDFKWRDEEGPIWRTVTIGFVE